LSNQLCAPKGGFPPPFFTDLEIAELNSWAHALPTIQLRKILSAISKGHYFQQSTVRKIAAYRVSYA
jgi:hypothetical protein